jgi:hypothetical protein
MECVFGPKGGVIQQASPLLPRSPVCGGPQCWEDPNYPHSYSVSYRVLLKFCVLHPFAWKPTSSTLPSIGNAIVGPGWHCTSLQQFQPHRKIHSGTPVHSSTLIQCPLLDPHSGTPLRSSPSLMRAPFWHSVPDPTHIRKRTPAKFAQPQYLTLTPPPPHTHTFAHNPEGTLNCP